MKSSVEAMAATGAILWGGAVLVVALANAVNPRYGTEFLSLLSSIYPGYRGDAIPADVAVVTVYAVADGAACGALAAWLNKRLAPGEVRADDLISLPRFNELNAARR